MAPLPPLVFVAKDDLSLDTSSYMHKALIESFHNKYNVGVFLVICLIAAVVLVVVCNCLVRLTCCKARDQETLPNASDASKMSQLVYSSMLTACKYFMGNTGKRTCIVMDRVQSQTAKQVVRKILKPSEEAPIAQTFPLTRKLKPELI